MIDEQARRKRALGFALAGVDWDSIAEQCGYADSGEAVADVEAALTENPIDALSPAATRNLNLARLSRLLAGVWAPAISGNNRSVEVASSLVRQIMKAQGIESTDQKEVPDHPATASAYDELAARRPGTPNGPRRDGNGRRRGRRIQA
jgi:hypothetical protein